MTKLATDSAEALDARAPEGTPLYVHLPFCAAKCHYCDFFSLPAEGHDVGGMVEAVLAEAERRAPHRPRTVFVGGGTPSLLSCSELERLLRGLEHITGFRSSASEVTAECNPESLDRDKAACMLDHGVDRLSIGFQSLRSETLELFGRVHGPEDGFRALEAVRAAGARNVNVDLIYASPGQTEDAWAEDLQRVLAAGPEHLSAYNLAFEEATQFSRWLEEGRLQELPEDVQLAMFEHLRTRTAAAGYEAYEISNYSLDNLQCSHNVNYWENGPYCGVGPSAVSKLGQTRRGNLRTLPAYLRACREGSTTRAWVDTPPAATRLGETWWLGLRTRRGVSPSAARAAAGVGDEIPSDEQDPAVRLGRQAVADGWLELSDEQPPRFRLSARGLPVADAVARTFLRIELDA